MDALVTGAAGFIGTHLTKRLREAGHRVIAVDSFTDYYDTALKRANAEALVRAGATLIEADLIDADLESILEGVDVIFHLAGQPGVRSSWGSEFATYSRNNVDVTQRLLKACRERTSLRRFVYASSSSVYGNADSYPTSEGIRVQPVSPYGVTKLAAEHLCSLYALNFNVPTVSLRYFTVYGPGQRPDMAFTRFIRAALQRREVTVYGSGEQVRDFTYVDDIVNANLLAATRDLPVGQVLNVAGGSYSSVNDVLRTLEELSGSPLLTRYVEGVAGDVTRTGGDTTAIRSLLGWSPSVGLREGLARQFDWVAAQLSASGTTA